MRSKDELRSKAFWCLLGINLFENLRPEDMQELSRYTQNRKYQRGEMIYLPGDPATTVYFLKKGRVKLVYLDEHGRKLTLAICRPGQPFGELMPDEDHKRSRFMAQALEDVELCLIGRDELIRFAQERPHLSLRLAKWVGQQLREMESKLEDLIFRDVPVRLARLLERLAREEGVPATEGIEISLKLTNREIADLIGSTRETTTVLLSQLRRSGVITKRHGRFIITDLEGLKQRCAN
ncbi:Crp/Fnr family transcriptional regulator [Candidatus Acetothermia bacterium]|nr:Crp/Fnr family transcriptional regulator [Candidatus Acetothermia bacterium]MBI3459827.1 Crp/Fnr family transcriptional regulator [Candidatus Acetothermia bacterium]